MEHVEEIPDEKLDRDLCNIIMNLVDSHRTRTVLQKKSDALQELNHKVSEGVVRMQAMAIDAVITDDLLAVERFALDPLEELLQLDGPQLQHSHMNDIAAARRQLQQRFNRAKDVVGERMRKLQERLLVATEEEKAGSVFFQALRAHKDTTKIIVGRSLIEVAGQLNPDATKAAIAFGVLYDRARDKGPINDNLAWRNIEAWSEDLPHPGYVEKLIAGGGGLSMSHVDSLARSSLQAGHEGVQALDKLRGVLSKPDIVPLPLIDHTRRALTRAFDALEETFREEGSASNINVNLAIVNPPSVVLFLHTIYQAHGVIHELKEKILGSSQSRVQSNCVNELGKLMKRGNLKSFSALAELTEHADKFVCRSALSRLCEGIPDSPVRCLTEIVCRIDSIQHDPIMWEMCLQKVSEGLNTLPPDEQNHAKEQVDYRVRTLIGPRGGVRRFWHQVDEYQRSKPLMTPPATGKIMASRRVGSMRKTHRP